VPAFDERLVVPRYNIAPTQPIVVVRKGAKGREFLPMRWGLIPWWAKEPKNLPLMIMARTEGITEKPAFRDAVRYRRCLIPASGFYEWQARATGPRQPYAIRPQDGGLIAFAGIWETWHGADGSEIDTAAIVTTTCNDKLHLIHDRMPVVVAPEDFATWLAPSTEPEAALALLKPAPEDLFGYVPVSTRVNAATNDDPRLLEETSETPAPAPSRPKRAATDPRQQSLF
jgi:putative SOS response-associated peptidase YedK